MTFGENIKGFSLPLTLSCVVAGLLVLALDFSYPLLVGSGVLYVAFLAIAINARSSFALWLLTAVYLLLHFIGYIIFEEQVFFRSNSLLKPEGIEALYLIAGGHMKTIRIIGALAIIFTSFMGYILLKKSEEIEEEQRQLSIIDFLTGAYSRRYLYENLKQRFSDVQRFPEYNFSLIILDIDNFKKINDTYSHLAGDVALRNLVDCAKGVVRNVDIIGRYGGEEFMVVSHNATFEGAMLLAERLRLSIESLLVIYNGQKIPLTISLGVTDYRSFNYQSVDEMIHAVDQALYRAKHNGRNQSQKALPKATTHT